MISAITDMRQAGVMAKVQIAVAGKILNMRRMQGSAAIELVEAASRNVTRAGDAVVAAATGLGGNLDVHA